jgi:cyclopropane-fatty-acyl-phospholipid synthase
LYDTRVSTAIALAERGLVPEPLVRAAIRRLLRARLGSERARFGDRERALGAWIGSMDAAAIAPASREANAQHYEVPAPFYELVLGLHRKYSSAYWPDGVATLAAAEEAMLALTAERAGLADGQRILDLGCGWAA